MEKEHKVLIIQFNSLLSGKKDIIRALFTPFWNAPVFKVISAIYLIFSL